MGAADVVPNCPALYTRKASDPTNTLASAANEAARGLTHRTENRYTPTARSRIAISCTAMYARSSPKMCENIATHCCGSGGYVACENPAYHLVFHGSNQWCT